MSRQLNPNMTTFRILGWLRCASSVVLASWVVSLSRGLLLLIAVELTTMPVTQHIWTWDKSLHGGQDFELSLLVIVACLCLALLRTEQSKDDLEFLVAIRAFLPNKRPHNILPLVQSLRWHEHRPEIPTDSPARLFILPLLI
jgi:hypothetical protein